MKSNRFLSLVLCAALVFALLPVSSLAASDPGSFTFDVWEGNIVIATGTDAGTLKVTYGDGAEKDGIPADSEITITGTTTGNTIVVQSGVTANITLQAVSIVLNRLSGGCAFDMAGATVNLTLSGDNALRSGDRNAGLRCPKDAALTIGGGGTLAATGGQSTSNISGAGIGGSYKENCGSIAIGGGIVTAVGGQLSAGIGGGGASQAPGGTITISDGTVTARGGVHTEGSTATGWGAGIGGGTYENGTVDIKGGTVTAFGGNAGGAGIGGGSHGGSGGTVSISGGTVTANGGGGVVNLGGGAGIGGGGADGGTVMISGGIITASGGSGGINAGGGAGIGGGGADFFGGAGAGTVTISSGTVTANGGAGIETYGNGIGDGGGAYSNGSAVAITGGSVKAGSISVTPTNGSLPVYLTTVTLGGVLEVTGVTSLAAVLDDVPYTYGINDMFTDDGGKLYLYLPENTELTHAGTAATRYQGYILTESPSASGELSVDTRNPVVLLTGVTPAGTGIAISTDKLSITFNEPMKTSYAGIVEVSNDAVVSAPQWSNGDRTVTYSLSGLAYETTYVVTIADFQDAAGNGMLPDNMWRGFTTETAPPINLPTVTTGTTITDITSSGATVSGSVTSDGGAAVSERGFVYGKTADPEIGSTGVIKVEKTGTTGDFSTALSGLSANTAYHVRAYAINSKGTSYGADVSFTTRFAFVPAGEPDYVLRTLTDQATGIVVAGTIHKDAALTVKELAHGADAACEAIKAKQADSAFIFLLGKDISLSRGFVGALTVTIPVGAAYNGQTVTILHCVNGALKTYTATVAEGKAVFTVTSLSPFAVFANAAKTIGVPNTGEGGTLPWLAMLFLGAFCGYVSFRRREAKRT